jgi:hypothetical protein
MISGFKASIEAHIMPTFASTIDHVTASADDAVKSCRAYALCTNTSLTTDTAHVLYTCQFSSFPKEIVQFLTRSLAERQPPRQFSVSSAISDAR